jgi:N4-gp56 family major capsid protein
MDLSTTVNNTSVYRNPAAISPLQGQNVLQPAAVYSKIMLRTIELAESDFEFAGLAMKRTMPSNNGSNEIVFKRMLALAAHTQPLVEGIPPASDQGRMVAIKAATKQFGRYMEFTDKVNWAVVDPLISEYTRQLSLKVPETKDLLAQQALLAECQLFYASEKEKNSTDEFWIKKENGDVNHIKYLTPDSTPTIDEFRRIVLTLEAAKVRPFMGKNYLALVSPAVYFDLITDDRVKEFMKYSQTGAPYMNDSVVDLFSLAFRKAKTIKTDNIFTSATGAVKYLYHVTSFTGTIDNTAHTAKRANVITNKKWEDVAGGDSITVVPLVKTGSTYANEKDVTKTAFLAMIDAAGGTIDTMNVHYSYVLGEEALFEISIEGHGTPQFISKPLGSAGTADPLNQRQSIGWKLDSIGYKVANPDAVQAYLSIPTQYRVNVNARPDLKNQFTEYDYGYVGTDGKYYHPAQVVQSVVWDGTANVVKYLVKGTTTEVLPQSLTKLITPVKPGRIDAFGKNMVVKGQVPTLEFALATNVAVQFDEAQVVLHTDGKFYIKGLAGTASAEVIALPATATTTEVLGDGTGTETRTSLFVKENIE